jgi:hypothetical protein
MSQRQARLSPPPDHGSQRTPRRPLAGTGTISARSKSAPSMRHGAESAHEAGPSDQIGHPDSSSQRTAARPDKSTDLHTEAAGEKSRGNTTSARINSDPSSSTPRSGTSHPDGARNWSERDTVVPRSNLTEMDVASLIVNKMVSTPLNPLNEMHLTHLRSEQACSRPQGLYLLSRSPKA